MTKRRKRPPPPVLLYLRPCSDCTATWEGTELLHEPTCPVAVGVDDACDSDRRYFVDNPGEWTRTRAITWAELQALDNLGTLTDDDRPDHVHIVNAPFGRIRTFCNSADFSGLAIDPDDEATA